MKQATIILGAVLLCAVLTSGAVAGDADDVRAAVLRVDDAFMSGNVDIIAQHFHPQHSRFFPTGLLIEGFSKDALKGLYEAGLKVELNSRHLDVKVFGSTAVATGYNEGTITFPDGTIDNSTTRFSEVWVKDGNEWKRVHIHASPLTPQQ